MEKFRIETDTLGTIKVPMDRLWGAQTQRSLKYFNIGNDKMPKELIKIYAIIKQAAASVNYGDNKLSKDIYHLILDATNKITEGKYDDHFPLHVWMTGSGTHFNMNMNEVISNLCSQASNNPLGSKIPVHPNNHVNMSQSTNDTFPSAMYIATIIEINSLITELKKFYSTLSKKSDEWKNILKIGRTHLQDAVTMTLGQEFSAYATLIQDNIKRIENAKQELFYLPLGGTALGTGINAPKDFDIHIIKKVSEIMKLPFKVASNKFAIQSTHDTLVQVSSSLKTLANSIYKISNDIRLLSSGPRCGFNELLLPINEPGSSIMPGKVNPSQCEALSMIAIQVMANDYAITLGNCSGILELNIYKPLIIFNMLNSIQLLHDGCRNFRKYLLEGMKPNFKKLNFYVQNSLMIVTALSPIFGYDKAAEVAHKAYENDLNIRDVVLKEGLLSEQEYDKIVNKSEGN